MSETEHDLSVQQTDALWDAVAVPGVRLPTFPDQHERVCRAVSQIVREAKAAERHRTLHEVAGMAQGAVLLYEGSDEAAAAAGAMEGMAHRLLKLADEPALASCLCTTGSPEMYESPARDCPFHGEQSVVAYRAPGLDIVYCVQCHPDDGRFNGVGSDDLPDGGICANCDTDVLIRVAPSPCPRCGGDVSRFAPDDLVYRSGDKRPYCSSECVAAMDRADGSAMTTDAEIVEMGRQVGLVRPEDAPRIVAAAREFLAESGIDTPGCNCAHEGMGPAWHLKSCSWLATLTVPHPDAATSSKPETEVRCEGCGHHEGEGCGCPPPARGIRGLLEHVGIDTTGRDIRVGDRVVDAWPHSCDYRSIECNLARTRQEHTQHDWEPQPGMTPLHCPGYPKKEGNR